MIHYSEVSIFKNSHLTISKLIYLKSIELGVNLTVQDLLHQDARIQDLYYNVSEMKLSITSLYIISEAPQYDIIWTEKSDVIDSFISEIYKYESSVIVSLTEKPWAAQFTPEKFES